MSKSAQYVLPTIPFAKTKKTPYRLTKKTPKIPPLPPTNPHIPIFLKMMTIIEISNHSKILSTTQPQQTTLTFKTKEQIQKISIQRQQTPPKLKSKHHKTPNPSAYSTDCVNVKNSVANSTKTILRADATNHTNQTHAF